MSLARSAGRALLGAVFIHGGWCTLRDPEPRVRAAASLLARWRVLMLPSDKAVVRLNAAVHVGAGLFLAAGLAPRVAARVLALSLIPTTIAGHPIQDAEARIQIAKNAGIVGGLILAAAAPEDARTAGFVHPRGVVP
jgi:putative oxidoreductase